MPIFEFRCKKCGNLFEVLFRNREEKLKIRCPACDSEKTEKQFSVFGSKVEKGASSGDMPPCASTCTQFS